MNIHVIEFSRKDPASAGHDPYRDDTWHLANPDYDVLCPNPYQSRLNPSIVRHALYYHGPDNVHNAPDPDNTWRNVATQGAGAYLIPLPVVISNPPRPANPTISVEPGDLIIDHKRRVVLRVEPGSRFSDPTITVLSAPPATTDWSEFVEVTRAEQRARPPVSESWLSG